MANRYKPYKNLSNLSEEELSKKLVLNLMGIIAVVIFVILATLVFAPKIGSFFGFFSVHRNDEGNEITLKLNPPIISNLPESVGEDKVNITGFSVAGATIKLYVNGPEVGETVVGGDGIFTFNDIQLNNGKNTIFAKALDGKGGESDKSQNYQIVVDKDKPDLEITSPKDGSTVRNLDKRILVEGKVNEKTSIKINDKMAILKPDLTFEFWLGVEEGDVGIKVEATDAAGNISQETIDVKYSKRSN